MRSVLCSIFFLFLLNPFTSSATHITGADLSYRWISGNSFELNLSLYRDCSGIAAPSSVSINYRSASCSYNMNVVLNKIPGTGIEITQPCSSSATICGGGITPGIQKYEYSGNVTLPSQCSDWIFSYSICCRNCAITTLSYTPNNCSGVPATYIEATLNNLLTPNNSSPVFSNIPVSFYCIGQTFHYNNGVYDTDGDSLVYSFINPRSAQGTDVVFNPGYNASNPISSSPPVSLDNSGDLIISPTALEVGVMAILVSEYRNGVLIGSIIRDMEIWTQSCTNNLPTASGINGTTDYDLVVCPGQAVNFTINSSDADSSQTVTMTANNNIPGSTFTATTSTRPVGTFIWNPTLADARNQPYIFTVTVQDDNCPTNGFQTYSYKIKVPAVNVSINGINSNCSSPSTGGATVIATGTGPFQYLWSNGSSASSITGLLTGSYTVTVTDTYGCTSQASASITAPSPLTASPLGFTNISCNGSGNGSVSVLATGGYSPYTYSWSPSGGTGATASGLSPGIYTVTITDANGCTTTMSATIGQPAPLTATISGSNIICYGNQNGAAAVAASGGTPPYSYSWTNGSTSSSITGVGAGSYSVVITDASGCTVSASVSINQPTQINISTSSAPSVCNISNGSISAIITGGTGPYICNWNPGGFNSTAVSNLAAGTYTITVSDNNGCVKTNTATVSNLSSPAINVSSISHVKCNGGNDGAVSISLSGGTGPFTYSWSPYGGNSSSAASLSSGNYIVSVTDLNNCTSSLVVAINEPAPLQSQVSITDPSCGLNSGSATIIATGGTTPYNYSWMPGNLITSSANNLAGGNYSVIITDAKGCKDSVDFILNQPSSLTGSINSVTDVTCYGGNNGAGEVSASGGNPPYSYSWFPNGDTLPLAAGLIAGNYMITITDANHCSVNVPLTISQPSILSGVINSFGNVACSSDSSGFANVQVSGGTLPYSYSWSPGGENIQSVTGLGPGNYSVMITDDHGCITNSTIAIIQPVPLSLNSVTATDVSCSGGSDGSVSVFPNGGTAPYSYQWFPAAGNTSHASNLTAGNYSVIVTDANGCSDSISVTINEPPPLNSSATSINTSCYGGSDGSIALLPSGGTPPYSYSWSPGNCTSIISTGLTSGTYNVVISDSKGCTFSTGYLVDQPPALNLNITSINATCGNANGSANVSVSGGTPVYFYTWGPVYSNDTAISNIAAGAYSVIVEDANGCSTSASVGVSNSTAPVISVSSVTPVSCYGGNNGAASISLSGGTNPFKYTWTPSGGNTPSAAGLSAGTYTITVKDKHHCVAVKTINISEPPAININMQSGNVTCNGGNDGTASVAVSGGTGTYNYLWNNGVANDTAGIALNAGNYSVTVTDQNGCTETSQTTINEPALLSAVITNSTPVSCNGRSDGSANVTVTGGTAPYQYSWTPAVGSGALVTGLPAGNYSVLITDATGCTAMAGVLISEPPLLTAQTASLAGTCGQANGTASVFLSGGTQPYSYLWNQTGEVTSSVSGLSPGNYLVTCNDMNGCQTSATVNVINTGMLNASIANITRVTCNGGNDGSALINVSNGSPPYSYHWQPSGGNSSLATGLAAGTYSVIVNDTNNCLQNLTVVINEPPALSATVIATHVTCSGSNNGSASVIASGGTGALTYNWLPGGMNTPTISSLNGGNYVVEVTDAQSCTTTTSFVINEPQPLLLSTGSSEAGCNLSNGSVSAHAWGGSPPYHFLWNPGNGQDSTLNGIPAGSYSIDVSDSHGCTVSAVASVSNFTGPSVTLTGNSPVKCFGGADGSAEINVTNGSPPYTYNWFPNGGNTQAANNLSAGSYSVSVRDSNNCATALTVTIIQPTMVNTVITPFATTCQGGNDGSAVSIAAGGFPPYVYTWSNGTSLSTVTNLSSGNYSLTVADSNECNLTYNIFIPDAPSISLSAFTTHVNCYGGGDGTATIIPSGGTPGYTYQWSNGSTTQMASNLLADSISVIVTDINGCKNDTTFFIAQPDPVMLRTLSADISCPGVNDGTAEVHAQGGVQPYYYEWLPAGGNSEHAYNLASGNYTVTVRDENGCIKDTSVQIGSPLPLALSMTSTGTHCFNGNDGHASVSVTGGIPPFSYFWDNGSAAVNAINLHAGTYTVAVTDQNGCTSQQSISVGQPPPVLVSVDAPAPICIGQPASLEAEGSGGTPGYNFTWSNGIHNGQQTVNPASTAHYSVIATDANGCHSIPAFVTVTVNPPLLATASAPDSICEGSSAVISGFCSGGNGGPYNYSWDNGQTGQYISVFPPATQYYTVTATDNCGSPPVTAGVTVFVNPNPRVNFLPNPVTGCQPFLVEFHDDSDKDAVDFYWSFGDGSTDTAMNPSHVYLNPGSYTVNHMVKNDRGCTGKFSAAAAVVVNPKPWAVFKNDPETASIFSPQISFMDESINADHWKWDFGDKSGISEEKNAVYSYVDTGTYTITLITKSDFGCMDTAYGKVTIKGEFAFYIPNAFTPNNDGVNDVFGPLGIGVNEFNMSVFDRWGSMIFSSTDITKGWDGHVQGSDKSSPADVYVYKIIISDLKGIAHEYKGHVNLVR